jgi:hypothetical protein
MTFGLQLHWQTHIASFTVKEAIAATYATNPAVLTMILVLCVIVVEEIAGEASVLSKSNSTLLAIRLHLLTSVAFRADELFELFPVECVRLCVIVTEAT